MSPRGQQSQEQILLLQTICNKPADTIARLVYADWLDEHDRRNGFKEHAKLIRYQCEHINDPPTFPEVRKAVKSQLAEYALYVYGRNVVSTVGLSKTYGIDLGMTTTPGVVSRGFVCVITSIFSASFWVRHGPRLVKLLPVETVGFADVTNLLTITDDIFCWCSGLDIEHRRANHQLQNMPWVDDLEPVHFDDIHVAISWLSTRAIAWAVNESRKQ